MKINKFKMPIFYLLLSFFLVQCSNQDETKEIVENTTTYSDGSHGDEKYPNGSLLIYRTSIPYSFSIAYNGPDPDSNAKYPYAMTVTMNRTITMTFRGKKIVINDKLNAPLFLVERNSVGKPGSNIHNRSGMSEKNKDIMREASRKLYRLTSVRITIESFTFSRNIKPEIDHSSGSLLWNY